MLEVREAIVGVLDSKSIADLRAMGGLSLPAEGEDDTTLRVARG